LDEEVSEMLAGEQSCESRHHRPVRRVQRRSVDLAPQYRHLVAQHDDLDGEIGVTTEDESDQLEDAAERLVEEREGHGRMLAAPESRRQSAGRRPWMAFSAPTGFLARQRQRWYHTIMEKTTLYLPEDLKSAVKRAAAERGVSEAEIIRQSIRVSVGGVRPRARGALYSSGQPIARDAEELLAGFGER
jgi:hypothetical protein